MNACQPLREKETEREREGRRKRERGKEKEREGRRQIEIERGRETGGRELFERSEITTRNYFWDL